MRIRNKIWIAYDKNRIVAIWWTGCRQPYLKWRKAVKGLYSTVKFDYWNVTFL